MKICKGNQHDSLIIFSNCTITFSTNICSNMSFRFPKRYCCDMIVMISYNVIILSVVKSSFHSQSTQKNHSTWNNKKFFLFHFRWRLMMIWLIKKSVHYTLYYIIWLTCELIWGEWKMNSSIGGLFNSNSSSITVIRNKYIKIITSCP